MNYYSTLKYKKFKQDKERDRHKQQRNYKETYLRPTGNSKLQRSFETKKIALGKTRLQE